MNPFQLISVPLCAFLTVLVLFRGVRGHLGFRQALFWGAIWGLAATVIAFPASASVLADRLGIGRGADLVFYAAVLAGLAACLYFYQRCRRLESLCTELMRREAIREARRGNGQRVNQTVF